MDEHDEFDLLDGYALGTLSVAERERVREHLAGCPSCRREYDEIRNVLDVLPHDGIENPPADASRARLLARIDALEPAIPKVVPLHVPWTALLAAGFVLALAADGWFAWRLHDVARATVAIVPRNPIAAPTTPAAVRITATPAPATSAARPTPGLSPDVELRRRLARLEHDLADERQTALRSDVHDAARIRALQAALARSSARLVALQHTIAKPVAVASVAPSTALVAALSNGHVYGIDGVVGSEPWHLTIVQPPNGAHALIYSQVPDAPAGDTYRAWVLRDGKTFDAGELPAATQDTLEMPMPLEDGDVVAFSREPIGSGNRPTSAFLMQITIKS